MLRSYLPLLVQCLALLVFSTGPVPITSLLTAVAMMPIAVAGSPDYLKYLLLLTFLSGIIQFLLGILRFVCVVNFFITSRNFRLY